MVEATQAYHSKVLTAIRVIAERYAREEVKRLIRASGAKLSQYPSRHIARMALALPEERWKESSPRPRHQLWAGSAGGVRAARTAQAQRKTVHILKQSVITCPTRSEIS